MADGLNKAMLIGNLGADPELHFTQQNRAVLKMRLATSETWMDGDEKKERTEWHNVVLWGKRAEGLAKIITKGDRIYVEGRIETRSYEKDGVKKYATEISALNVILLGGGKRGSSGDEPSGRREAAKSDGESQYTKRDNSEIPF